MSASPPTRPSLLLRLRDTADAEAWRQFVELYTPLVYGYCAARGLQEADAADVAQEVMRTVARAMPDFAYDPQRGKFRGWLLQVTRFKLQKFWAHRQRHPQPAGETTMANFSDQEPGADEQARWEEDFRQRLFDWAAQKARPEFQPRTWQAFWLTAVESLPAKDAAERVGLSLGAVYIARSRVIARLRELVESVSDESLPGLDRGEA